MSLTIDGPKVGLAAVCEPILRALPDWFGIEEAIVQYVQDIEVMPTFVASMDGEPAGFLTVKRHFDPSAEIHVMGIRPGHHRRGIGRELVERVEAWLLNDGVEYLQVKTVGPSRENDHYAQTRDFYTAVGFRPLEEFPKLWDERNPCLLLVKKL
ncbi:MAG: GNAT family N-acetyltransferase [Planctomycetota bacterium]|jgi:GNAT superfamily N-acetyltransferase